MGYDMQLCVFKKKTLEYIQKELGSEQHDFAEIFSECLFCWLYPNDYKIPADEVGRYICYESTNIFKGFFEPAIESNKATIIDKETYEKMFRWLENKLKSTSLFDLVDNAEDESDIYPYIRVYKNMRETSIDFETEFIVFEHSW